MTVMQCLLMGSSSASVAVPPTGLCRIPTQSEGRKDVSCAGARGQGDWGLPPHPQPPACPQAGGRTLTPRLLFHVLGTSTGAESGFRLLGDVCCSGTSRVAVSRLDGQGRRAVQGLRRWTWGKHTCLIPSRQVVCSWASCILSCQIRIIVCVSLNPFVSIWELGELPDKTSLSSSLRVGSHPACTMVIRTLLPRLKGALKADSSRLAPVGGVLGQALWDPGLLYLRSLACPEHLACVSHMCTREGPSTWNAPSPDLPPQGAVGTTAEFPERKRAFASAR